MDADAARTAAHLVVLKGLRAGTPLDAIELGVTRCRVRGVYEPDLAMIELIVAALDVARASPAQPLNTGDWPARFLPGVPYRNRHTERERLTYALYAAAAFRTRLRPDILTDTYSWGGRLAAALRHASCRHDHPRRRRGQTARGHYRPDRRRDHTTRAVTPG